MINFKTYSKNFKNKKRLENDPENWKIFKEVHEPIIERAVFERVQEIKAKTKRRAPKSENGGKHLFSDYLYCADCGKKLWYHTNTNNKTIHFFSCSNYEKDYRGTCKTRHYIRADALEHIVKLELRRLADFLADDEEAFTELLAQRENADMIAEQAHLETELKKATARSEKVEEFYEKLYEDNADGKVTDEWFTHMAHKYETERLELKDKIKTYRVRLSDIGEMQYGKEMFIAAIRNLLLGCAYRCYFGKN